MKYFYRIAKIILYCIIGGMLGFIVMFMGSYFKANSIANDIARNGLLLSTQYGCLNYQDADDFCNNMHEAYGYNGGANGNTKSIIVANYWKNKNSTSSAEVDKPKAITQYVVPDTDYTGHYGLISVKSGDTSLINAYDHDYEHHVQRGQMITVNTTVECNMHFNWVFGANRNYVETKGGNGGDGRYELRFCFPVNASATGVSCKWFKGDNL